MISFPKETVERLSLFLLLSPSKTAKALDFPGIEEDQGFFYVLLDALLKLCVVVRLDRSCRWGRDLILEKGNGSVSTFK